MDFKAIWARPCDSIGPYGADSSGAGVDLLDMEPDDTTVLGQWREAGIDSTWLELPGDQIGCFGWGVPKISVPTPRPTARVAA